MQPEVSIQESPDSPINALIGIGSNLGDRQCNMATALTMLDRCEGCEVRQVSELWETEPVNADGGLFLNAVALVSTTWCAMDFLRVIKSIELGLGRTGTGRDARPIDIDILFFHDTIINSPELIVPHPRWRERGFVTVPLASVCGDMIDPETGDAISAIVSKTQTPDTAVRFFRDAGWY